jgi:signal transduction histidine kinase/DNA-binding response OmpR family regulator/HAMP domain-containing protein
MKLNIDTLGKKIGLGFLLLFGVFGVSVTLTILQIRKIEAREKNNIDFEVPSVKHGLIALNGINSSIASLRGWILFNDSKFKEERKKVWQNEIRPSMSRLSTISSSYWGKTNIDKLASLFSMIEKLESYQEQAEELETAQAEILSEEKIVPLAQEVNTILNQIIDDKEIQMNDALLESEKQIAILSRMQWVLLLSGLLISFISGLIITKSITTPISGAVDVAKDISDGNLETEVNVGGSVELRVLSTALMGMRDSLKSKARESELYSWRTRGQNELYKVMTGYNDVQELANSIISFLSEYISSNIGALYLANDNYTELNLTGKYSFYENEKSQNKFVMGEGVIGQVAITQKKLSIGEMEPKDISIKTSLVQASPKYLFIVPFLFEGKTLGILEFGSVHSFTKEKEEFIESVLESISIAINSAIADQKIKELLEETQQQSEELQTQQEELQQSNEELEEQTQKLKEQQEELQATNEELEEQSQALEEKNKDLSTAREDIELKAKQLEVGSKYKSEFLANMSHELRTPLNSLLILSNDLLQNRDNNLNEEQLESASVIAKSGYDLLNLINEILDLSKIEAGKMGLNIEEFRISDLADNLNKEFKVQAREKGLNLEFELDGELPSTIRSDQKRIEQILKNLITNAIKFTHHGTVKISFRSDAGNNLVIQVLDTGIGIPRDKQDVVFEAFQQLEGGTARKYGGTGLGLSISRELSKMLGGRISLESEVNKGSSFTLILPIKFGPVTLKETKDPHMFERSQPEPESNSSFLNYPSIPDDRDNISSDDHVVLIIEDDEKFCTIIAEQARKKGFKYLAASTGEDGLVLTQKYKPHAIILDLKLPGIDGQTVLRTLKGNPDLRHIQIHIISGMDRSLDSVRSGAVQFMVKPVNRRQLSKVFNRIEDFINRKMKSLLILEDDENLRKSIRKLVGNGDVECLEAGSAREAIDLFMTKTIDCVVLDIGLPDKSGFELIHDLEDRGIHIPPIIVYTGKELSKEENEELRQYSETIIVKGVKSEERLLDETALFLHRTVNNLPKGKQQMIESLYDTEKIFNEKKILVVDDDMRNVFALSKVLRERGMKITKADNGVTALDLLDKDPEIDLVLMDIMMPEMDGYECIENIRRKKRFEALPIIALTAKAMKDDRQKCLDAGANDYIAKPVDVDKLLSLMRLWIQKL